MFEAACAFYLQDMEPSKNIGALPRPVIETHPTYNTTLYKDREANSHDITKAVANLEEIYLVHHNNGVLTWLPSFRSSLDVTSDVLQKVYVPSDKRIAYHGYVVKIRDNAVGLERIQAGLENGLEPYTTCKAAADTVVKKILNNATQIQILLTTTL